MSGLARAVRRVAVVGLAATRRGESGGGGKQRWGWGLALGLAMGVKAAAGGEAGGGPEEEAAARRGFGAAIERSRDLLRRIKVPSYPLFVLSCASRSLIALNYKHVLSLRSPGVPQSCRAVCPRALLCTVGAREKLLTDWRDSPLCCLIYFSGRSGHPGYPGRSFCGWKGGVVRRSVRASPRDAATGSAWGAARCFHGEALCIPGIRSGSSRAVYSDGVGMD